MPLAQPLLVPGIRLRGAPDPAAEEARALERARRPWVAGFCLFGGEAEPVRRLTARLREAARRPLFVASDMERGAGQQVEGLRCLPEAGLWGLAATPAEVEWFGRATAAEALSVGVDVLFAPVLDVLGDVANPIVGPRSFSWDPQRVATLGSAFARGALRGGAVPVAKHYPGHGATVADSHDDVPVVDDPVPRLVTRDLLPYRALLSRGLLPAVMTAHVVYPALDPSRAIATFSRTILDRLRATAGPEADVAVFTDALCMEGAKRGIGEIEAARRALLAGCDLLLCPDDPEAIAAELGKEVEKLAEVAAGRARRLLERIAHARASAGFPDEGLGAHVADAVARRAVQLAWTGAPERRKIVVLDDADAPEGGAVLLARGREVGVPVEVVRFGRGAPAVEVPRLPPEGGTVVVLASVGAAKGRWGLSEACRAALGALQGEGGSVRWVWCGPCPGPADVHLPGTGPETERALAACLLPARA